MLSDKEVLEALLAGETLVDLYDNNISVRFAKNNLVSEELKNISELCLKDWKIKPKTININGFEVPEPIREPLEWGQFYFIVSVTNVNSSDSCAYIKHFWKDDEIDRYWLQAGLIHLTPEASIQHTKALLSFTERDDVS